MKINKLLIALLLLILTVGVVSASDENITTDNITDNEALQTESSIEVNDGTFAELEDLIENSSEGNVLELENDYTANESEFIHISKQITLDGKGHVLDANNISGAISIRSTNVILKNIVFKNTNAYAIVSDKENLTVDNCSFINCSSEISPQYETYGVVAINWANSTLFKNCNFINCTGTAIYFTGSNLNTFINTSFINCHSTKKGGAICFENEGSDTIINNCSFVKCSAYHNGGAIYFDDDVTVLYGDYYVPLYYPGSNNCIVSGCNFMNCDASKGGCIYWGGLNGKLENSNFTSSTASYGGAIYWNETGEVVNSNFINNTADLGGAIFNVNMKLAITGCNFINNTADETGGATYGGFISDSILMGNSKPEIYSKYIMDYDFFFYNMSPDEPLYSSPNGHVFFILPADINGKITPFIDGVEVPYDINNLTPGSISRSPNYYDGTVFDFAPVYLNNLQLGNHTITLKFSQDKKYYPKTISNTLIIRQEPDFGCDYSENLYINSAFPITIDLPKGNFGNFSVYLSDDDGQNFKLLESVNLTDSSAAINFNCTQLGKYVLKAEYDTNYVKYAFHKNIEVTGIELPTIDTYPNLKYDLTFTVRLPSDGSGNFSLYVSKDRGEFTLVNSTEIINGSAEINFIAKKAGNYEFEAIMDSNYGFENKTEIYTIEDGSKITASDVTIFYGDAVKYSIKVYGENGKLVGKDTHVNIKIGSTNIETKTNSKGVATVSIPKLKPGTYTITSKYNKIKKSKKLTVKHVVTLKSVKVKRSGKKLVLQATLKNKKALKNKHVTFKFNGKTYKAKTNSKGIAKVTIKKSVLKKLKVGKKITYQATYGKDTIKKTVKVQK